MFDSAGIGLQLTNILRDVGEDLERGRIYLPLDEIRAFGLTEDDLFRCVWCLCDCMSMCVCVCVCVNVTVCSFVCLSVRIQGSVCSYVDTCVFLG